MPYLNLPYPIYYSADLFRVEGDLLAALGDLEAAEMRLMRALEIARDQKAKSFELRAAISLSKFWTAQNNLGKAREVLAGVYDWFSEGFATADLEEAKRNSRDSPREHTACNATRLPASSRRPVFSQRFHKSPFPLIYPTQG